MISFRSLCPFRCGPADALNICGLVCALGLIPALHGQAGHIGPNSDPMGRLIARMKSQSVEVRESAVCELRDHPVKNPRIIEPLVASLDDAGWLVRECAAEALGKIKDPRAVEPLIALLKGADNSDRTTAAEALGRIGDRRAVDSLIAALMTDENEFVRVYAARALGELKDPKAVDPLINAFKGSKPRTDGGLDVNGAAVDALGEIGDARAVEPLIAALNQSGIGAVALGKIRDPRAIGPLISALQRRSNWDEWDAESEALGKIGAPAIKPLIAELWSSNSEYTREIDEALTIIGKPAVPDLVDALANANSNTRWNAAYSLSGIDDPRAESALEGFQGRRVVEAAKLYYCAKTGVNPNTGKRLEPISDELLIQALSQFGDHLMADYFVDSESDKLRQAASDWAYHHNYVVRKRTY